MRCCDTDKEIVGADSKRFLVIDGVVILTKINVRNALARFQVLR